MGEKIVVAEPAIWCHEHDQWECRNIDGLEDQDFSKRKLVACHTEINRKQTHCEVHLGEQRVETEESDSEVCGEGVPQP